jgi:hypothetical protein
VKWLTDQPQGFSADGRMVGLSLTAAMDDERQQVVAEAEGYLRGTAAESRGSATSL